MKILSNAFAVQIETDSCKMLIENIRVEAPEAGSAVSEEEALSTVFERV